MAASSSGSQKCDVFPSFRGEDVRSGFLSHLLEALDRNGSMNTFKDHGIERSRQISLELVSPIKESKISIVIFSKNYASSKWCLDELVEIHKCYKELSQMVIPVFYNVDPSEIRKQNGEFGESFMKTCEGKSEDQKQMWKQALTDVANLAGEHLQNWSNEASMVKKIATDVFDKLFSTPSSGFGDFVGIEAHIEAMESILCLESKEVRMVGIWGQSGIGKSTLGRALFSHLSPQFPLHAFLTYKSTDQDVFGMKLFWEKQLLDGILDKNIKVERLGMVEPMLKDKKVLIVLDDVTSEEFLKTLVGKPEWFGSGSRIIVISQDSHLLKAHKIELLYEVKIPDEDIALKMLCQYAFGKISPPEDFKKLAVEVAKIVGNLPLGLSVLGSSLKGRTTEKWKELFPGFQKGLKDGITKTLRIAYDRLDEKEREIFLWIACVFNGKSVKSINNFFGDYKGGIDRLVEKSLIRIRYERYGLHDTKSNDEKYVEMHNLLEKLGTEIVSAESKGNPPAKPRFLTVAKEVRDVLTNRTGTETVLGINLGQASFNKKSLNKKSFEGMYNLQFLEIDNYDLNRSRLPNGLVYLQNLKWLDWYRFPLKRLPSNFKPEFLVELRMVNSKLEKLWEGTQQLGSLKKIIMSFSIDLKEISDLSNAINLETIDFYYCWNLKSFPSYLNWESLEYLNLLECNRLKDFCPIKMESLPHGIEITVIDDLWNKNLLGHDYLECIRGCSPTKFLPEHLVYLSLTRNSTEKLWEGVKLLGSLQKLDLSSFMNLKEIPDLSKATNLVKLGLRDCKSLVTFPSTIGNLKKLETLEMTYCIGLEVLPIDVNLSSLKTLDFSDCLSLKSFPQLSHSIEELHLDHTAIEKVPCLIEMLPRLVKLSMRHCSSLKSFPQLSRSIEELYLDDTAIEEVPCFIEMFWRLTKLSMCRCSKLKNISPNIFRMTNLKKVDFSDCGGSITALSDATYENVEKGNKVDKEKDSGPCYFKFENCLKLDTDARELIIPSSLKCTTILPRGDVPKYFNHRADGNSLTVTLPQSSLSHQFLRFNVCVVVKHPNPYFTSLHLDFRLNGVCYKHVVKVRILWNWEMDHLILCSFKIRTTGLPSTLDFNDVEFKFNFEDTSFKMRDSSRWINECGIRVLNVSTSTDDIDGRSSEKEYNQHDRGTCDVVEIENNNKEMQMTSSEQNFNLPCDQIVTDTGLIAPNLELPLGRGESSSVSSYPCPEREVLCIDSMITEQQDAQIPIVNPSLIPDYIWQSSSSTSSERASSASSSSIFSCWGGLLKKKIKESVEVSNSRT